MAKAFGTITHLALMMPLWMNLLLGNVKPLLTLILLGPPIAFLYYMPVGEERDSPEQSTWKTMVARHLAPIVFFALALIVFVGDITHVIQAFMEPTFTWKRSTAEALQALACSSNLVSMLNMIGLVGLHSKDNANEEAALMIRGEGVLSTIMTRVTRFQNRGCVATVLSLPIVFMLMILVFAVGGFNRALPEDAVLRMKSGIQQWYVRFLYCAYKKLYHVLLTLSLIGIFAYCWLFAITGIAVFATHLFLGPLALRACLKVRHMMGLADAEQTENNKQHMEHDNWGWIWYLFFPGFVAQVVPVAMPLTLRLLSGEGYFEALTMTWTDRRSEVYFSTLQQRALSVWDKFIWVTGVSSLAL